MGESGESRNYAWYNAFGLVAGLVVFVAILAAPTPEGVSVAGHRAGAVAALMAVWWLSEAAPLAATSLLPIALFPLFDVMSAGEVTREYGDANIFLFAGGFFIAMAMQKWNLHERIALNVVLFVGTKLDRLVLGFMVAGGFISMWVSNTATALMMVPIAAAVIGELAKRLEAKDTATFATCLLLGVAYSSSIGGMGTLIGTPPNLVLAAQFTELFPEAPPIGFLQWMLVAVPLVVLFIPITWLMLTKLLFRLPEVSANLARSELVVRRDALGAMNRGEKIVLTVAATTALAWIFRADIALGDTFTIPGWANAFPNPAAINDATVAIFFAALLFVLPVDIKRGEFALDWEWARRIPWEILILFGGGLAVAKAFNDTGMVAWIGERLDVLSNFHPIVIVATVCLLLTFVTEMTSNTATTTIMMPIVGGAAATAIGVHPLLLMFPAAISASCAFMMPVATPPNAIVFGAGYVTIPQMARAGLLLNLIGVVLVTAVTYFLAVPVFGISLDTPPLWAQK